MAKKIEIHQTGPEIKGVASLHGKVVKLIRGDQEVTGVLLSKDTQGPSDNLAFQWKNKQGVSCISEVTKDELEELKKAKKEKK